MLLWGLQDTSCVESAAVFNQRWYSQLNAILNIIRTLFVAFALGFAMITFNRDAQRLVLRPIERMLHKVKEVSENPLAGRANSKIKVRFHDFPITQISHSLLFHELLI